MIHIITITMRGFFRKEKLGGLPTGPGIGIAFKGIRREEGVCNIVRFASAFKCDDLKQGILSYSQKAPLQQVTSDIIKDEIDYYAYALLDVVSADIVARVLNVKMAAITESNCACENAEYDMRLLLEGTVPLIWNDKKVINFMRADYVGGVV